jgi:hypothetical protein
LRTTPPPGADRSWKYRAGIIRSAALPANDQPKSRRRAQEQGAPRQSADPPAGALVVAQRVWGEDTVEKGLGREAQTMVNFQA